jgi:hypothetical protein
LFVLVLFVYVCVVFGFRFGMQAWFGLGHLVFCL